MTYNLAWSPGFIRSYKKWIRKNPNLKEEFQRKIRQLCEDPYHRSLYTHSLTGKLQVKWSIRISWKHRLIFTFSDIHTEEIILFEIGDHEEVY
jgi:mRNA-degrading endonuclease YafQ of YafQ-DinJ toxin-antitoxin module